VSKIDTKPKREAEIVPRGPAIPLPYFIGCSQASVTALSMMCRSTLWHLGQLKVRKSWPNALGSIAVSFIGDSQAMQHGPWFCESSIGRSPIYTRRLLQFGARNGLERHRPDAVCTVTLSVRSHSMQSKVHRSKPKRAGLTRARASHLVQARASVLVAEEDDCDAGMRFPFRWAGALHSQSPMDAEAGR
jgi:hypothetical protein